MVVAAYCLFVLAKVEEELLDVGMTLADSFAYLIVAVTARAVGNAVVEVAVEVAAAVEVVEAAVAVEEELDLQGTGYSLQEAVLAARRKHLKED